MNGLPRLMLVTDRRRCGGDPAARIAAGLAGGPALVQIREKDLDVEGRIGLVRSIREPIGPEPILVVNGCPETARATGAGLHLPAASFRENMRPAGIGLVGCSIHSLAELEAALSIGPDYLLAGTVFPTRSKPGAPGIGLERLEALVAAAGDIPVFAIGGVDRRNASQVRQAGAWGAAVVGAWIGTPDPAEAVRRILAALARPEKE